MTDKLNEVASFLCDQGIVAYYVYPGFLSVPNGEGKAYNFGFSNGPFGWDLSTDSGGILDGGESSFGEDATIEVLADFVCKTIYSCIHKGTKP